MLDFAIIQQMSCIYNYTEYLQRLNSSNIIPPKELYAMHIGIYLVACYEHPELDPIEAYSAFYGIKKQGGCCGGSNNVL